LLLVVGSIAGCTAAADEPSSDSSTVWFEKGAVLGIRDVEVR
jgi:hypothetical protein